MAIFFQYSEVVLSHFLSFQCLGRRLSNSQASSDCPGQSGSSPWLDAHFSYTPQGHRLGCG